jgi:hypothetical protein
MTPAEHGYGEALIAEIQRLIEEYNPALASWALASALATLKPTMRRIPWHRLSTLERSYLMLCKARP